MTSAAQQLVDIGYGPNSNLYKDVLKVSRNASKEDIQSAFVDRRFELYGILQNTSSSSSSSSSVVDDSTGGGSGSKISLSERQFTEKKMDALVATFRILYDPAKRLEYNAKLDSTTTTTTSTASKKSTKNSNRSTRSSTITIKQQQQQQQQTRTAESSSKITKGGSNETSTSIASGCSRSSTASSLNSSKSKTRRQGLSTAKGGEQRVREAMEASTKNRDEVVSSKSGGGKRSSDKRIGRPQKNNTKQTIHKAPSSNLPSTKLKSPKSAIRANTASNSFSSLRETTTPGGGEPILKRVENGSQQQQQQSQPLREVENIMGGTTTNKKLKKGLRTDKHPPSNVSNAQAAANAAIENNVLGIPRTKSTVSWKDGTKNTPPKKKQTTTTSSSSSEQIDVDDIDANSCFLMDYEDRSNTAELVESKNSFSGFLRSSGYENQAYLVEELGNEVRGLTADTLLAVDQVLNAFKIGDDDIDAIVGNIREEKDCLAKHIRY